MQRLHLISHPVVLIHLFLYFSFIPSLFFPSFTPLSFSSFYTNSIPSLNSSSCFVDSSNSIFSSLLFPLSSSLLLLVSATPFLPFLLYTQTSILIPIYLLDWFIHFIIPFSPHSSPTLSPHHASGRPIPSPPLPSLPHLAAGKVEQVNWAPSPTFPAHNSW